MSKRPSLSPDCLALDCDHCGGIDWEIYQDGKIVCGDCDEEAEGVRVRVLAAVPAKRKK